MENRTILNGIYLKIYTEDDGATLVFEGQSTEDIEGCYYPTRLDDTTKRFGTTVIGVDHIVITHDAVKAFERILREARHTTSDIGNIEIGHTSKHDIYISYIGDIITKINIEDAINTDTFSIGCREVKCDPSLVRSLICVNNFKTNKALDFVLDYWYKKFIENREDVTESQAKMFMYLLRDNLGYPYVGTRSELNGGCVGLYDKINPNIVEDALKLVGIEYDKSEEVNLRIVQWLNQYERSIVEHRPCKTPSHSEYTYLCDIVEDI